MSGNAGWGSEREALPPGDYLTQITDVKLGESTDFKDPTKKKPSFIWSVDVQMPDGTWESRSIFTSRTFTDMAAFKAKPNADPKFISGLNKLVRACGKREPTSLEEAKAWSEESLIRCQFIWRIEQAIDEETGLETVRRKFLPCRPQAAEPAPVAQQAAAGADDDPFEREAA